MTLKSHKEEFTLGFPSVLRMGEMLCAGTCTSLELVQHALSRVQAFNDRLHAFIEIYTDSALHAARAADEMIAAGYRMGPLHGIPVALKDNIDVSGRPSMAGSLSLQSNIATSDAWVTSRLLECGAVIIGKTHMTEFALGAWGGNETMGTPRNPWGEVQHLTPGGSSSGSAVAVAAGMVPLAIGTDTGASVRVPAALCGITGLKPTIGRLPTKGVVPLSTTHDSVGILTVTAEDAAVAFATLARDEPSNPNVNCELKGSIAIRGLRVGYLGESDLNGLQPEVLNAYARALNTFRDNGAQLRQLQFPASFDELADIASKIVLSEASASFAHLAEDESLTIGKAPRSRLRDAMKIPAAEYIKARRRRTQLKVQFLENYGDLDVFLTPTTQWTAKPVADVADQPPPVRYSRLVNLLDLCGISVQMGEDRNGLPIALQIAGATNQDARILTVARAYQACTSWHLRRWRN